MTNPILFATSWLMFVSHTVTFILLFSKNVPILLVFLYTGGSLTSIINHGTSHFVSEWIDRTVMTVGLCIDIGYIISLSMKHNINNKNNNATDDVIIAVSLPLAIAILAYFLDKCQTHVIVNNNNYKKTLPHVIAHFCITISHINLLFYLAAN